MLSTIPLSLYIHFPWCIKKCPYCDFNSHQPKAPITQELEDQYIDALILDLSETIVFLQTQDNNSSQKFNKDLLSIFIGGGTPSLFSAKSIENLLNRVNQLITIPRNCEITLEANPGTFESQKFTDFQLAGINRLSIGVQSFDNTSLKLLGRIHDNTQSVEAIRKAKELNFNLNIDLMHSLPAQTIDMALHDLQTAINFEPNHLSWYQLTIEPNTQFAKQPPVLPNDTILDNIYYTGLEFLANNNYHQYEISAFANNKHNNLDLNKSIHNSNYWRYGDYIGIGAGAHGKYTTLNKDDNSPNIIRQWKQKSPVRYLDKTITKLSGESKLSSAELILEYMMNRLRLLEPICAQELRQYSNLYFDNPSLLKPITVATQKKWVTFANNQLTITDLGRRFLNDLILLFA